MIGVARHSAGAGLQIDPDTQPVNYSLSWPTVLGTGAFPPTLDNLLSWGAVTVNYWIYIPSSVGATETQSFRIGGINFGYNGVVDQLYINECVFTGVGSDQWVSVLYQNSQAGNPTVVRVNDVLPANRTYPGYGQTGTTSDPPVQPATANQSIGNFTSAHRNHFETPETVGNYTNSWINPILGLVRYSTTALDLSTRDRGTARWTAWNTDNLPGRDILNLWSTPYLGYPTKTLGTSGGYTTHTYNWPSGFAIGARQVDPTLSTTQPLALGMRIAIRWTPTNDAEFSFVFPQTA